MNLDTINVTLIDFNLCHVYLRWYLLIVAELESKGGKHFKQVMICFLWTLSTSNCHNYLFFTCFMFNSLHLILKKFSHTADFLGLCKDIYTFCFFKRNYLIRVEHRKIFQFRINNWKSGSNQKWLFSLMSFWLAVRPVTPATGNYDSSLFQFFEENWMAQSSGLRNTMSK